MAAALLAGPLAVAGCSGDEPAGSQPPAAGQTGPAAEPSPAAPAKAEEITLAFAGDVHFTERTARLLANPATAFGPVAEVFKSADYAMVNLETAVTTGGKAEPKQYHFRTPPTALEAVKAAGVDIVSSANNHTLDYGQTGLSDTLANIKSAGLPMVGAGKNAAEAWAPYIADVKGHKVAFIGISQVWELASTWIAKDNRPGLAIASDVQRSVDAVKAAKAQADLVVVYMHWGQEGNQCAISDQKTFAKKLSDAGADIIVGTHSHVLHGDGYLGKTYVAYGLSNFLWYRDDAMSNDTGVLKVTVRAGKVSRTEFVPASISRTTGQPVPVTGAEKDRIAAKYAKLRGCTGLAAAPAA